MAGVGAGSSGVMVSYCVYFLSGYDVIGFGRDFFF